MDPCLANRVPRNGCWQRNLGKVLLSRCLTVVICVTILSLPWFSVLATYYPPSTDFCIHIPTHLLRNFVSLRLQSSSLLYMGKLPLHHFSQPPSVSKCLPSITLLPSRLVSTYPSLPAAPLIVILMICCFIDEALNFLRTVSTSLKIKRKHRINASTSAWEGWENLQGHCSTAGV
jgi:hypothetical protein